LAFRDEIEGFRVVPLRDQLFAVLQFHDEEIAKEIPELRVAETFEKVAEWSEFFHQGLPQLERGDGWVSMPFKSLENLLGILIPGVMGEDM